MEGVSRGLRLQLARAEGVALQPRYSGLFSLWRQCAQVRQNLCYMPAVNACRGCMGRPILDLMMHPLCEVMFCVFA